MKKLLVIVVALAAVNAQATRARVAALGNSPHLVDTQTVYNNPADLFFLGGDYVSLETGTTANFGASAQNASAEGMIVRSMGDAKMGLSLGHQSQNASSWGLRNAGPFAVDQQNPVEFTYGAKAGDMAWAGTLVYSNYQDKVNDNKESSMGVRFGARTGQWDAALRLGLVNTVEIGGTGKYTGTLGLGANAGYYMDNMYVFGSLSSVGFKTENTAGAETSKFTQTAISVGVSSSMKKDGTEVFYGARINNMDQKETVGENKQTAMQLPLWIGVEADAASWLTLRGSVTQTLQLMNNMKETDDNPTPGTTVTDLAPGTNDTTVNAGVGFKFNKVTVDATLQATVAGAATTQQFNGNSMFAMLGMSYWY